MTTQTIENQATEQRPYATLYAEMRALLTSKDKPKTYITGGVVDVKFFAVYLAIRGKDWKRSVDLTSEEKVKKLVNIFQYEQWYPNGHFVKRLTVESRKEFHQVCAKIHKELVAIKNTL